MTKKLLILIICLCSFNFCYTQSRNFNALSAKVLLLDYGSPNLIKDLNKTFGLEVNYTKNLNSFLNFSLPVKIGVINVEDDINNRNFISLDGLLQMQFQSRLESPVIPYVLGGIGIVNEKLQSSHWQLPVGVGLNFRIGRHSYINVQGEYRASLEKENRNNYQFGVGYFYRLNKADADDDGIADLDDQCPTTPGKASASGCPDSDEDGIADSVDDCPILYGKLENGGCPDSDNDGVIDLQDPCPGNAGEYNGCPDSDEDGIPDHKDKCPQEFGVEATKGCPIRDLDGDGLNDDLDQCPQIPGPIQTKGCPDTDNDGFPDILDDCPKEKGRFRGCPDSDNDGLADNLDACPDQYGIDNLKGCPELSSEVLELLDVAMQAVQFSTGKSSLKEASFDILDQIANVMKEYPGYQLAITGHTDNTGDERNNLLLSELRAGACYQYLIEKGIDSNRMKFEGFGQTKPIVDNDTEAGKQINRRVEFRMYLNVE